LIKEATSDYDMGSDSSDTMEVAKQAVQMRDYSKAAGQGYMKAQYNLSKCIKADWETPYNQTAYD
jgi:hypothetical protein